MLAKSLGKLARFTHDFCVQYCDRLAGVDANGTKIILCLNMRSFKDEDIIVR